MISLLFLSLFSIGCSSASAPKKMRRRFWNLLAILTLSLIFASVFRPSVNPSYDEPSVNQHTMPGDLKLQISPPPILAYPCPACDYPPWLVEFLLKWFGILKTAKLFRRRQILVGVKIWCWIIFRSSLLSSLTSLISPDELPQPMDFAIHTGKPLPKVKSTLDNLLPKLTRPQTPQSDLFITHPRNTLEMCSFKRAVL